MGLRNKPYLHLYVQDFLTDEKLNECSAEAVGVFIKLMLIMTKSEEYGTILLKQNDKQSDNQIENFACKVAKQLTYSKETIYMALVELVNEKVVQIDGNKLMQKRMVQDNILSEKRARAGSEGGKKTQFAKAKVEASA